jgi:putative ABC transport system permease protein
VALVLRTATDSPFNRTRAATNGPDVVAAAMPRGDHDPEPVTPRALAGLEHAGGVAAFSGPFPVTWTQLHTDRSALGAEVEGRTSRPSAVDRPEVLHGSWVRDHGVVVEAGFADALDLHVGDHLRLGTTEVEVAGTAVTAAIPDYPQVCAFTCLLTMGHYNPGLIWATPTDLHQIARAATSSPLAYYLNLELNAPADTESFIRHAQGRSTPGRRPLSFYTAQYVRSADNRVIANLQLFLFTASSVLGLLALASVAVLVGGRMAEQTRRVGLLKAIGGTPRLVATVLLCENALLGLAAAGLGLGLGRLIAPAVDGPGAGLLAAPAGPPIGAATITPVIALALAVAIAATVVPAVRAARASTITAIDDAAHAPRRHPSMVRLTARLPAPLLLGSRLALRRPRRLLLNLFSVAVTVSTLIAVLILRASEASPALFTPNDPLKARLADVILVICTVLVVLAAINALFIAWTTALESRHAIALARALGATPEQVTTGLATAQLLPALAGSLLGVPGGIGIYYAFTPHAGATTMPSAVSILLAVIATPLIIGLLTAIPTRIDARRPAAPALTTAT